MEAGDHGVPGAPALVHVVREEEKGNDPVTVPIHNTVVKPVLDQPLRVIGVITGINVMVIVLNVQRTLHMTYQYSVLPSHKSILPTYRLSEKMKNATLLLSQNIQYPPMAFTQILFVLKPIQLSYVSL